MSCKLMSFQTEKEYKILEHTKNGVVFHYLENLEKVEEFVKNCENKCEVRKL